MTYHYILQSKNSGIDLRNNNKLSWVSVCGSKIIALHADEVNEALISATVDIVVSIS